jgi:hypothetical protein
MKKTIAILLFFHLSLALALAQTDKKGAPSSSKEDSFRAYLYNKEFEVYLRINFYEQNITVPGQELYGELPSYLGKKRNSFCWAITSAKVIDEQKEKKEQLIGDYAKKNEIVHQLIDLALLQNGLLKGEALDRFLKRSVDLIK